MLPFILGQVDIFKKLLNNGIRAMERNFQAQQQQGECHRMFSILPGGKKKDEEDEEGKDYDSTPLDDLADGGMIPEEEEEEEDSK